MDGCAQMCTNSIGNYSCSCRSGYRLASDGHWCTGEFKAAIIKVLLCIKNISDINECTEDIDTCQQLCLNTMGSYNCDCNSGYRLASDGFTCNDIDECAENTDGCAQNCINTEGSYICSCRPGYSLADDGHWCMGKPNVSLNSSLVSSSINVQISMSV